MINSGTRRPFSQPVKTPTIFMMDLWATVPYYTAYLSRALLAQGANVTVGSITYYLDPTCFSSRGLQLDPGVLDLVGKFQLPRLPRRILKLLEALLNMAALTARFLVSPPDIVHVQYLPMLRWPIPVDVWFVRFCKRRGSKIVLTVHDLLPHDTADAHKEAFQKLYADVDAIICHSGHVKQRLETEFAIPANRISVIPHGPFFYDLPGSLHSPERTKSPTGDQVSVLWQGIIFPYKGLDLLLESWKAVEAADSSVWLTVAGTGSSDLLDSVREQVQKLGLRHVTLHLRFISTEELVTLYRAADIVVYPYRAITTSGALATGLALGKTILASDLPVFRELLRDGDNAVLVEPNSSGDLAAGLIRLAQDPILRKKLASAVEALEFGNQSWSSISIQTMQTYGTVCSRMHML